MGGGEGEIPGAIASLPAGANSPVQAPPTGGGGALAVRPAHPWSKATPSYGPAGGKQAGT